MTDKYPGLYRGPAGPEGSYIMVNYTANAAIPIGSPVKWVSPIPTGEIQPRVTPSTASTDISCGIAVDGDYRGTYGGFDTSVSPNPSNVANAAGQGVSVVEYGRVKVVVDGSTASIAIGDALAPSTLGSGFLKKATTGDYIVARAMQISTAYGDIILANAILEGTSA